MELKRVLNRWVMTIMFVCILFSLGMFYREQTRYKDYKNSSAAVALLQYSEEQAYKHYNDMLEMYNGNLKVMDSYNAWLAVRSEYRDKIKSKDPNILVADTILKEKVEYIDSFDENVNSTIAKLENDLNSGFYKTETVQYMNLLKTRYDLKRYGDIDVKVDNGKALKAVLEEKISHVMLLVIIVSVVYQFLAERKRGLWELVHISIHGRCVLAIKRFLILGLISLVSCIIMYSSMLIMSLCIFGGWEDMFNYIQCDADYMISEFVVSRIVYFVIYVLFCAMAVWTVGALVWAVLSIMNNQSLAACIMVGVGILEYVMFMGVDFKSEYNILRHLNIFKIILPSEVFLEYRNWGIGSNIWSHYSSSVVYMVIVLVFSSVCALVVNTFKKPIVRKSAITRGYDRVLSKVLSLTSGMPNLLKELKKNLIVQKGVVVIVIAIAFVVFNRVKYPEIISDEDMTVNEFYKKAQGMMLSEELYNIRDSFVTEKEALSEELKNMAESGIYDVGRYQIKSDRYEDLIKIVDCANNNIESLEKLEERGIRAKVITPFKLRDLFGIRLEDTFQMLDLVAIFVVIMLSFSIYSFETKNNMTGIIKICKKGRKGFYVLKLCTLFVQTLMIWGMIYGYSWNNISSVYEFEAMDYCIQGYLPMSEFPIEMTVEEYVLFVMLVRLLIMLSVAMLCFLISVYFNYLTSFVASVAILIPHIIYVLGADVFSYISVVKPMDFARWYLENGNNIITLIPICIMILVMVISSVVVYRRIK